MESIRITLRWWPFVTSRETIRRLSEQHIASEMVCYRALECIDSGADRSRDANIVCSQHTAYTNTNRCGIDTQNQLNRLYINDAGIRCSSSSSHHTVRAMWARARDRNNTSHPSEWNVRNEKKTTTTTTRAAAVNNTIMVWRLSRNRTIYAASV